MDIAGKSALRFFARLLLLRPLGMACAFVSMLRGTTAGALIPLLSSRLLEQVLGHADKPKINATIGLLTTCLAAEMILDVAERQLMNMVRRRCRKQLVDYLAIALAKVPPDCEGKSYYQFFSAFLSAAHILLSALPGLVVGMTGFVIVLINEQAPWPVFVVAGIFITIPLSAHWLLKRVRAFHAALKKEEEELEALGLIFNDRRDAQVQSALDRYRRTVTEEAGQLRRQADNSSLIHVATRAFLCAGIFIAIVQIIPAAPKEMTALLVVFALTFTRHINTLYYFAEFFHKIDTEATPLMTLLNQPKKPPLPPARADVDGAWIKTKDLRVTYCGKNFGHSTLVQLGDFAIGDALGGSILLNDVNGKGKTTFVEVLDGRLPYEGSVNCWGYELNAYDPGKRIAHFTQTRRPKPIALGELFKGEDWTVDDEKLMQQTLEWAGISEINLEKLHSQLSEGLRQKADLALFFFRAIKDKGIFVCLIDEPMNHIAWPDKPTVSRGIYAFLTQFDSTAVVISHDPTTQMPGRVGLGNRYLERLPFDLQAYTARHSLHSS